MLNPRAPGGGRNGLPRVQGEEGLKGDCVEVLEDTETMKMSGNRCKWYRVSVNII